MKTICQKHDFILTFLISKFDNDFGNFEGIPVLDSCHR